MSQTAVFEDIKLTVNSSSLLAAIESLPFFEHGRAAFVRKEISIPGIRNRQGEVPLNLALDPIHGEEKGFTVPDKAKYLDECAAQKVMPFSILECDSGQLKIRHPDYDSRAREYATRTILEGKSFFAHVLHDTYSHQGYFANPRSYLVSVCDEISEFDRIGYTLQDAHFHLSGSHTCYDHCSIDITRKAKQPEKMFEVAVFPRDNFNNEQTKMFSSWLSKLKNAAQS